MKNKRETTETTELTEQNEQPTENGTAAAKPSKTRKALNIVFDVVLYLFLAIAVFALIVSLVSSKNNGASNVFGYEMRLVVSDSMEKSEYSVDVSQYKIKQIKVKSVVFIERVPEDEQKAAEWYDGLEVGDVLTFAYVSSVTQDVITHRITDITPTANGYLLTLKGDNRASETAQVSEQKIYTNEKDYTGDNDKYNYVIGKVVGQSSFLGLIIYGVSQPVGAALIVILPCALIMIWQIIRIVNVVNEERKQKAAAKLAEAERLAAEHKEQSEQQARELEELKRKFEELSKQQPKDGEDDDGAV